MDVRFMIVYVPFTQSQGEEAQDKIGMKDAAMFPFYASGGLFSIYLFFKVEY